MPKKTNKLSKKSDNKKDPVFDVAKPGKAEPNASSRPIIVTRRPIVEDPMVRQGGDDLIPGPPALSENGSRLRSLRRKSAAVISISEEGNLTQGEEIESPQTTKDADSKTKTQDKKIDKKSEDRISPRSMAAVKEIIEPDSEDEKDVLLTEDPTPKVIKPTAAATKGTKDDEQLEKTIDKPEVKTPEAESGEEPNTASELNEDDDKKPKSQAVETNGLVDELAKEAANKKQKGEEDKDKKTKQANIDKLVTDKTYFLPVGQVTRRKNNRRALFALLLIILLALVAANFALDAGLLQAPEPIKPLTDVIPN